MSYDGCCAPGLGVDGAPERLVERELIRLVERDLAVAGEVRRAAEPRDQVVREVPGADAIRFLRRFGFRARREERVAAHVGGLVDEERRPRPAALQARERAGRARVEDGDAHVGGNLIEPIAQRAVGVAIVAEQQSPLVGVAGVVDEHLRPSARGTSVAPRVRDARAQKVERVEELAELRLPQDDLVAPADAAELDEARARSARRRRRRTAAAAVRRPPKFAPMTSVNRCTGPAAAAVPCGQRDDERDGHDADAPAMTCCFTV